MGASPSTQSEVRKLLEIEFFEVVDANKNETLQEEELQELVNCIVELNKVDEVRALHEIIESSDTRRGSSATGELAVSDLIVWFNAHEKSFTDMDLSDLLAIAQKHRARRRWHEAQSVKNLIHRLALEDIQVNNHPELGDYLRSSPKRLGSAHMRLTLEAIGPMVIKETEKKYRHEIVESLLENNEVKLDDAEAMDEEY